MSNYNDGLLYKGNYRMTSDFGPRILDGVPNNHKGMDFVGDESKHILSPVDGVVKSSTIVTNKSNLTWQWGNYVRIDSGAYKYYFCHMSKRLVGVGQTVKKGDVLGTEGQTGYSFGSHCHFEIRDSNNVSVDPKTILWKEDNKVEIKTVDEALNVLQEKGIMNTTEYWKNASGVVKYLDALLINVANAVN